MKSIALGLAAALLVAALAPATSFAATGPTKESKDDVKKHQQAMTEAPPVAKQLGLNCTVTDANFLGVSKAKDEASGKEVSSKIYEVACQEGLGYMLRAPDTGTPDGFDCLAVSKNKPPAGQPDKGGFFCHLPANDTPLQGLQTFAAKSGLKCTVAQARWMGADPAQKFSQYELACSEGPVYVMQLPDVGSPKTLTTIDCMTVEEGGCQFMTKEKKVALITALAAPAKQPCQVTDAKWIGKTKTGESFYEVACTDEKAGFVMETSAEGQYLKAIDCGRAMSVMGASCTLTSAVAAQTEANSTYTRLAKEIGYPCDVKSYHFFGQDKTGREIVELSCNDHPDGAIATLPTEKGQTGEFWNCARAEAHPPLKCALAPPEATNAKLAAQIASQGKTCQVSKYRGVGTGATGDDYVEVACSGAPGYMIEYKPGSDSVASVIACTSAKGIGTGCTLK